MIPKVDCITHALKGNMSKAVIIDGRIPHSILIEIFLRMVVVHYSQDNRVTSVIFFLPLK